MLRILDHFWVDFRNMDLILLVGVLVIVMNFPGIHSHQTTKDRWDNQKYERNVHQNHNDLELTNGWVPLSRFGVHFLY
jgi:hypothetical protein